MNKARKQALIEELAKQTGVTFEHAEAELIAEEWIYHDALLNIRAWQREA